MKCFKSHSERLELHTVNDRTSAFLSRGVLLDWDLERTSTLAAMGTITWRMGSLLQKGTTKEATEVTQACKHQGLNSSNSEDRECAVNWEDIFKTRFYQDLVTRICGKGASQETSYSRSHLLHSSILILPVPHPTTHLLSNAEFESRVPDYIFCSVWKGFHG